MKVFAFVLAIGALFLAVALRPAPAMAGLSFEDPQLCVNGKLLMIEPTTAPIDVWVRVGSDLTVDFNVVNCGGDPNLPVISADHVSHNYTKNWMEVAVKTQKHTVVNYEWDGKSGSKNSGGDNWIYAKTKVK